MMDQCPACEREFQRLEDYPLIYVASFNRGSIPDGLKLPYYDLEIYVGPGSDPMECNKRPPAEIFAFFKNNPEAHEFESDGWIWTLAGDWKTGNYYRMNLDQRGIIIATLNPYLDSLDGLVGREVPLAGLLPPFPAEDHTYHFPDTGYHLVFNEREKTPAGLRITTLNLNGISVRGATVGGLGIETFAEVGHLVYEGRVRK